MSSLHPASPLEELVALDSAQAAPARGAKRCSPGAQAGAAGQTPAGAARGVEGGMEGGMDGGMAGAPVPGCVVWVQEVVAVLRGLDGDAHASVLAELSGMANAYSTHSTYTTVGSSAPLGSRAAEAPQCQWHRLRELSVGPLWEQGSLMPCSAPTRLLQLDLVHPSEGDVETTVQVRCVSSGALRQLRCKSNNCAVLGPGSRTTAILDFLYMTGLVYACNAHASGQTCSLT